MYVCYFWSVAGLINIEFYVLVHTGLCADHVLLRLGESVYTVHRWVFYIQFLVFTMANAIIIYF